MNDPDAERLRWVERMAGVHDDEPDDLDEDDLLDEDDDTWKTWDEPDTPDWHER